MSDAIEAARKVISDRGLRGMCDSGCECEDDLEDTEAVAASALAAAWPILSAGLRELHRPVYYVFSWQSGLRMYDRCPDCLGKAGVHPCGCWQDEDLEYECRQCSRLDGGKGVHMTYPCPTMQEILDIDKELGLTDG